MRRIGSDPEFACHDANSKQRVMAKYWVSEYSCEAGSIGYDHGDIVGELHPHPGTPMEHLDNIKQLIRELRNKTQTRVQFYAGAWSSCPLGGHIHLERKGILEYIGEDKTLGQQLVELLDSYVGLPLLLTEPTRLAQRRMYAGYGELGSYSLPNHGLEYRTPSSWLNSVMRAGYALYVAWAINNHDSLLDDLKPLKISAAASCRVRELKAETLRQTPKLKRGLRLIARAEPKASPFIDWTLDNISRSRVVGVREICTVWDDHTKV